MALGGVATGNMKAREQETATGIIRYMGFIPIPSAWNIIYLFDFSVENMQKVVQYHYYLLRKNV